MKTYYRTAFVKPLLILLLLCVTLTLFVSCDTTQNNTVQNDETQNNEIQNIDTQAKDTHVHTYSNSVFLAATCTEDGSQGLVCTTCGDIKDEKIIPATGHSYNQGICTYCSEKDPNYVEYGSISGTITYKYNNFVGHRGDTGAKVVLIPKKDTVKSFDNSKAAALFNGVYESGIIVAECDGNGNYIIQNVPVGEYLVLIVSEETTDRERFDSEKAWKSYKTMYFEAYLNTENLDRLLLSIGYSKTKIQSVNITKDTTYNLSHDFGITYI